MFTLSCLKIASAQLNTKAYIIFIFIHKNNNKIVTTQNKQKMIAQLMSNRVCLKCAFFFWHIDWQRYDDTEIEMIASTLHCPPSQLTTSSADVMILTSIII